MVRSETARHKQTITTSPLDDFDNNYQNHLFQGQNGDGDGPFGVAHVALLLWASPRLVQGGRCGFGADSPLDAPIAPA
jgi:hypothetical protein